MKIRLLAYERAWLAQIFEAILPADTAGLPPLGARDQGRFLRTIEESTGPTFVPGLRAMLHALAVLPLGYSGYRRPFFALSVDERRAFVAHIARERSYVPRQLVQTMKILAAFAYFEDPAVRARFDLTPTVTP